MCSCVRKKESVVVGSCSRGTSYYTYLHEEHEVGTEKEPEDVEITGLLGGITLEFLDLLFYYLLIHLLLNYIWD